MKKNKDKNSGFTIVELVVVMALLVILVGAASAGILGWQDSQAFAQNEANAEEIYKTLQSRLLLQKSRGLYGAGNTLQAYKGDYEKYCKGEDTMSPSAGEIFGLLDGYLSDPDMLSSSIYIECENGYYVRAVYYSDRCEGLSYSDNDPGTVDIKNISEEQRREHYIGAFN